jgi:hypothetical protein
VRARERDTGSHGKLTVSLAPESFGGTQKKGSSFTLGGIVALLRIDPTNTGRLREFDNAVSRQRTTRGLTRRSTRHSYAAANADE